MVGNFSSLVYAQSMARASLPGVVIEGNERVEQGSILAYLAFKSGRSATDYEIDASIKSLFRTGFFSDVRIFRRGGALVVSVEENPLINKVYFEGNSSKSDKDLHKEIALRDRALLTPARAQMDSQKIVTLYRRAGYYNVTVTPKVVHLPERKVNLVYQINEGAELGVSEIRFVGNDSFSGYELRSIIATSESAWWKFFSNTTTYDPDRLLYDQELLKQYYLKKGFADFKVLSTSSDLAPDGEGFIITFVVEEGPRYRMKEVSVDVGTVPLDPSDARSALAISSGQTFDTTKISQTNEQLVVAATDAGQTFTRVQPDFTPNREEGTLDVVFRLKEGPRVYVERIDIVGNTRTLDDVIRRELRIAEGDAYNPVLVDRARRRLQALDFFEKIEFTQRKGTADDRIVLVVNVEEKSTGSINFSAGYSTIDSFFGSVSVSERNFLGRGQDVRLGTTIGFKRQSVDFSFTEPYFMGRNFSAGVDAYATFANLRSQSSFSMEQFGGALRVGVPLSDHLRVNGKYQFTHRRINLDESNLNSVSLAIRNAPSQDDISLVGMGVTYDDLDNPIKPTDGYRLQVGSDIAGLGGSVSFARFEASAFYFFPLYYEDVVLKLKAVGGHIMSLNDKDVSVFDRFFKGGDTFRGFELSGVGPRMERPDTNGLTDAIGGKTYAIATAEVLFPVGLPESFGLQGAAFIDAGTVFDAPETSVAAPPGTTCEGPGGVCSVFDSAALRMSAGVGMIWESPFGPLRLDVAWPILKKSYDRSQLVQFSIGTRF